MREIDIKQKDLFDELTPAQTWDAEVTKHAIDELFNLAKKYHSSSSYWELMRFIANFRYYSPYNAMLVHIQMPGARYVAPPHRWEREYGRKIKPNARPLVILQPMGPVMFVFDVSDTEEGLNPKALPPEVEKPFEVRSGKVGSELERTIENAKRDGVQILSRREASQSAGSIIKKNAQSRPEPLFFQTGKDGQGKPVYTSIPTRYTLLINENHSREARYATIVHELAHLYCGHLGTPNNKWWPDRRGLPLDIREFEAESVAYLICTRLGIDNPSEEYLSNYVGKKQEIPNISLECIMKAGGLIEDMGRKSLKPRKDKEG